MRSFTISRDVYAGVLLVVIGSVVVVAGREHEIGSLTDMQAGYFPVVLGILLASIGFIIGISEFLSPAAEHEDVEVVHRPDIRGGLAIVVSIICFVLIGQYAGLAPATFVSALIASAGDRDSTILGSLGISVVLTILAVALFVWVLKVPFPALKW